MAEQKDDILPYGSAVTIGFIGVGTISCAVIRGLLRDDGKPKVCDVPCLGSCSSPSRTSRALLPLPATPPSRTGLVASPLATRHSPLATRQPRPPLPLTQCPFSLVPPLPPLPPPLSIHTNPSLFPHTPPPHASSR
jgi:hypothetical protein